MILNYLNVVMSSQSFEHIFFTFRTGIDYNKNSLRILNLKRKFFVAFYRKYYGKFFQ